MLKFEEPRKNTDKLVFNIDRIDRNVSGWVVGKKKIVESLTIRCAGVDTVFPLNIRRSDVVKHIFGVVNDEMCGFSFKPPTDNFSLYANMHDDTVYLTKGEYLPTKTIYIHIAKTAGSSVNQFFLNQFGADACLTHTESIPNWELLHKEKIFTSGHITLHDIKKSIPNLNDYYIFTTLREPVSHIISHLSWVRYLSEPAQKILFKEHPKWIQQLSLKMKRHNLSTARGVTNLISTFSDKELNLFDNAQTQYLRNSTTYPVTRLDVDEALSNAKEFNAVGFDDDMNALFSQLSHDLHMSKSAFPNRENVLSTKFGLQNTEAFVEALKPLIQYDLILYNQLKLQQKD